MTTALVERSVGQYCKTRGCHGWAQAKGLCRCCLDAICARAVDGIGIEQAIAANPKGLERLLDDVLAAEEPDIEWHARKIGMDPEVIDPERFEGIA